MWNTVQWWPFEITKYDIQTYIWNIQTYSDANLDNPSWLVRIFFQPGMLKNDRLNFRMGQFFEKDCLDLEHWKTYQLLYWQWRGHLWMQSKWKIKLKKLWTSCLVEVLFENEGKRWHKFSVSQENFWWVKCGPKIRETYRTTGLMTVSNQFCDLAPKWRHEMLTYFKDGYISQILRKLKWFSENR